MIHYINSSVTFLFLLNIKSFKSIHIGTDRYILFFLTAMNDYIHLSIDAQVDCSRFTLSKILLQ